MEEPPFFGHREAYASLRQRLESGRLPHALIFLGPDGIGKRLVAAHLAKALLCEGKTKPCGQCHACKLVEAQQHPDLWLLEPEGGRIKIDRIRDLKRSFSLPPLIGSARAVLIPEAHALNQAAANALLKTLEEPPAATYFILGSHAAGWVPKTILSRCQKVRFSPLSTEELSAVLRRQGRQTTPEQLMWAQGSARVALQQGELGEGYPSVQSLYEKNSSFGVAESYALAQDLSEGEKLVPFLELLLQQTHRWLTGPGAETAPSFELLTFAERILEFRREMRQNANPKLHVPRLLMFFKEPLESRL